MIKNFAEMLERAKEIKGKKVIIAGAQGELPIEAAILAKRSNLCDSILVGDKSKIEAILNKIAPELIDSFEIVDTGADLVKACVESVRLVKENKGHVILKGKADTAILLKRGQIKNCIVDGPLAFDNAINEKAAAIKGITSPVAGKADILIVPNIEAGNIFGKSLTYYCNYNVAHVVMGTKAPILIPSRADNGETKMLCMAMGLIIASGE
ncbi:MAG: hypothetical protein B6226_01845 [Candidatus Cloacimonetes bacterium 4572_65]|nr:MAG: hypothetical protein B6226_01845 [Candidatus Cloacimonetes bacterium 4572_65]